MLMQQCCFVEKREQKPVIRFIPTNPDFISRNKPSSTHKVPPPVVHQSVNFRGWPLLQGQLQLNSHINVKHIHPQVIKRVDQKS
ncbi:hypothetical protein KSS87_019428, partial [Heliosperma pusillum]